MEGLQELRLAVTESRLVVVERRVKLADGGLYPRSPQPAAGVVPSARAAPLRGAGRMKTSGPAACPAAGSSSGKVLGRWMLSRWGVLVEPPQARALDLVGMSAGPRESVGRCRRRTPRPAGPGAPPRKNEPILLVVRFKCTNMIEGSDQVSQAHNPFPCLAGMLSQHVQVSHDPAVNIKIRPEGTSGGRFH